MIQNSEGWQRNLNDEVYYRGLIQAYDLEWDVSFTQVYPQEDNLSPAWFSYADGYNQMHLLRFTLTHLAETDVIPESIHGTQLIHEEVARASIAEKYGLIFATDYMEDLEYLSDEAVEKMLSFAHPIHLIRNMWIADEIMDKFPANMIEYLHEWEEILKYYTSKHYYDGGLDVYDSVRLLSTRAQMERIALKHDAKFSGSYEHINDIAKAMDLLLPYCLDKITGKKYSSENYVKILRLLASDLPVLKDGISAHENISRLESPRSARLTRNIAGFNSYVKRLYALLGHKRYPIIVKNILVKEVHKNDTDVIYYNDGEDLVEIGDGMYVDRYGNFASYLMPHEQLTDFRIEIVGASDDIIDDKYRVEY